MKQDSRFLLTAERITALIPGTDWFFIFTYEPGGDDHPEMSKVKSFYIEPVIGFGSLAPSNSEDESEYEPVVLGRDERGTVQVVSRDQFVFELAHRHELKSRIRQHIAKGFSYADEGLYLEALGLSKDVLCIVTNL